MSVKENLSKIQQELTEKQVKLVAVTKTFPPEVVREAIEAGHTIFGENKVQELMGKAPQLPHDVEWHLIGHLQRNKVKFIAPFIHTIQSIDSLKLLMEVDKQAKANNRTINCLIQIHIAQEETKFGLNSEEAVELLESKEYKEMKNIRICGLMGMATFTEDEKLIRSEFRYLKNLFNTFKKEYFANDPTFNELSMGMSSDYKIAIEEGSTIVRIGSAIFGVR
jgi:PLP dependent protein